MRQTHPIDTREADPKLTQNELCKLHLTGRGRKGMFTWKNLHKNAGEGGCGWLTWKGIWARSYHQSHPVPVASPKKNTRMRDWRSPTSPDKPIVLSSFLVLHTLPLTFFFLLPSPPPIPSSSLTTLSSHPLPFPVSYPCTVISDCPRHKRVGTSSLDEENMSHLLCSEGCLCQALSLYLNLRTMSVR